MDMKEAIEYFSKDHSETWEKMRNTPLYGTVEMMIAAQKEHGSSGSTKTYLIAYQRFRRLNDGAIDQYLHGHKEYDKAMETLWKYIGDTDIMEFWLFLDIKRLQERIKGAKESLDALIKCGLISRAVDDDYVIDEGDIKKVVGDEYEGEERPDPRKLHTELAEYLYLGAAKECTKLLLDLDDYGLILAFMQENNVPGAVKESWDLFWEGVDVLNKTIPSLLMGGYLSASVSTFREDLYDVNPILDHVTNHLFIMPLERSYMAHKEGEEEMKEIEREGEWFEDHLDD